MKYALIDAQRGAFDLSELCRVVGVSISGYPAWQRGGTPCRQCLSDAQLLALIEAIHAEVKGAYGSPRLVRELRARGSPASKGAGGAADAGQRHPGAPQAALQGDDGLSSARSRRGTIELPTPIP